MADDKKFTVIDLSIPANLGMLEKLLNKGFTIFKEFSHANGTILVLTKKQN